MFELCCFCLFSSGTLLASGSDGSIHSLVIWHRTSVNCIPSSSSQNTNFDSTTVYSETWKHQQTFAAHPDIQDLDWDKQGKIIATVSVDNSVMVWNVQTGGKTKQSTGEIEYPYHCLLIINCHC